MVKDSLAEEVQFEQRPRWCAAEQSYVDIWGESVPIERAGYWRHWMGVGLVFRAQQRRQGCRSRVVGLWAEGK